ncbi:MAG TPA: hypothetical protein VKA67_12655 [Verrucomicrobiae bacterium]|nr:hypothetical protein [Verrucomicrobiae bacterium]
MLARVTGQNHAGILFAGEPQKREHLSPADLACFIHDDGTGRKFALEQEVRNLGRRPGFLHIHNL